MGEKDERGKALFANVERGVGIFLQNCHSFLYCRMAGAGSSPTMLFIRVGIKIELVMMVGLPSCNVGRPIYI